MISTPLLRFSDRPGRLTLLALFAGSLLASLPHAAGSVHQQVQDVLVLGGEPEVKALLTFLLDKEDPSWPAEQEDIRYHWSPTYPDKKTPYQAVVLALPWKSTQLKRFMTQKLGLLKANAAWEFLLSQRLFLCYHPSEASQEYPLSASLIQNTLGSVLESEGITLGWFAQGEGENQILSTSPPSYRGSMTQTRKQLLPQQIKKLPRHISPLLPLSLSKRSSHPSPPSFFSKKGRPSPSIVSSSSLVSFPQSTASLPRPPQEEPPKRIPSSRERKASPTPTPKPATHTPYAPAASTKLSSHRQAPPAPPPFLMQKSTLSMLMLILSFLSALRIYLSERWDEEELPPLPLSSSAQGEPDHPTPRSSYEEVIYFTKEGVARVSRQDVELYHV